MGEYYISHFATCPARRAALAAAADWDRRRAHECLDLEDGSAGEDSLHIDRLPPDTPGWVARSGHVVQRGSAREVVVDRYTLRGRRRAIQMALEEIEGALAAQPFVFFSRAPETIGPLVLEC